MNFVINKIKGVPNDVFITNLSFLTLISLWFFNPNNKMVVVIFFILFFLILFKTRNLLISLLIGYLVSSNIFTGKTHTLQLLDLRQFPHLKESYPFGYGQNVIIGTSDIFLFFILLFLIRNFFKKEFYFKLNLFDIAFLSFCFFIIIDNIIVSKRIFISLYSSLEPFKILVLSFALKFMNQKKFQFKVIIKILLVATLFQSFIAIEQFFSGSPLGKSVEIIHMPSQFGGVADEAYFTFRPSGTFFHSNGLGIYLSILFPVFLSLYLISFNRIFALTLIINLVVIALSLSRSAWVSLYFALLYLVYQLEYRLKLNLLTIVRKYLILLLVILVPCLIYSTPRIAKTIYMFEGSGGAYLRIKQAQEIAGLIKTSPFLGVGSGMSVVEAIEKNKRGVFASFPSGIHIYYFLILAENGLIGLVLFFFLIFFYIKDLMLQFKRSANLKQKVYLLGIVGGSFVIFFASFFQPGFCLQQLVLFFYLKYQKISGIIDVPIA